MYSNSYVPGVMPTASQELTKSHSLSLQSHRSAIGKVTALISRVLLESTGSSLNIFKSFGHIDWLNVVCHLFCSNSYSISYLYRNYKFNDVHVDGARRIARIAREMEVEKLIHFSHINASPNPPGMYSKGGSKFLISKV